MAITLFEVKSLFAIMAAQDDGPAIEAEKQDAGERLKAAQIDAEPGELDAARSHLHALLGQVTL